MSEEYPCPFCGETIKKVARICRFCKSDLVNEEKIHVESFSNTPYQTRPKGIIYSEILFYVSCAIELTMSIVYPSQWDEYDFQLSAFFTIFTLLLYAFLSLLTYLATRKANNIARWILSVNYGLGFAISLLLADNPDFSYEYYSQLDQIITVINDLISLASIYLFFTPKSNAWFRAYSKYKI